MKKIYLYTVLFLLGISSVANAQFGNGSAKDIAELKNKTLLVLLYDSAYNYNSTVKSLVDSTWKYGKYEFISADSLHNYKKRKDILVLGFKSIITAGVDASTASGRSRANGDKQTVYCFSYDADYYYHQFSDLAGTYDVSNVFREDKKYWYGLSPFVSGVLIDENMSVEYIEMSYYILLGTIQRFEQSKNKESIANWFSFGKQYSKIADYSLFKSKTLCVIYEDIPDRNMFLKKDTTLLRSGELSKSYSYEIAIVKYDNVEQILKEKHTDKLIFQTMFLGGALWCRVYDPVLKRIVYADCVTSRDAMKSYRNLLEQLNKSISK